MIRAVLFDFDGTLADSSEGIFHTALYSVRELGITKEYSDEDLRRFVGPPLHDCFRTAFGMEDPELIESAVAIYRREYDSRGYRMMHLYPGMVELIKHLKADGIKVGVATFKGEQLVKFCLENLGVLSLFDSVHGSDMQENRTKGDIIRLVLDDFSLSGNDVLMIGDTINDLKGAKEAGVQFLGVTYGFGFTDSCELEGYLHADSATEIYEEIKNINGGNMIEKIETTAAPAAIGPYSQAIKANGMIFASGQIPIDPASGNIVEGNAADQAKQVFKNIKAVLAAAGSDITKVVKATVFLKSMDDFGIVNEVYAQAFSDSPVLPARSAVAVAKLPKDVLVEVEVIALC